MNCSLLTIKHFTQSNSIFRKQTPAQYIFISFQNRNMYYQTQRPTKVVRQKDEKQMIISRKRCFSMDFIIFHNILYSALIEKHNRYNIIILCFYNMDYTPQSIKYNRTNLIHDVYLSLFPRPLENRPVENMTQRDFCHILSVIVYIHKR